jgi:endonuclease V-like protein UPF0215 family
MKQQIRILGIDDAPFTFTDASTMVVGVVMRGGEYVEGILRSSVIIDGTDATDVVTCMVQTTRHREQLRVVMLDGICLGGFNIVDIQKLNEIIQIPVLTVTRDRPDLLAIEKALRKHFPDWEHRLALHKQGILHEFRTAHNPLYAKFVGCSPEEAQEIISRATIRGVLPEPLRIAHLIASGIVRGESYGKA